jgi:hypothetical protein
VFGGRWTAPRVSLVGRRCRAAGRRSGEAPGPDPALCRRDSGNLVPMGVQRCRRTKALPPPRRHFFERAAPGNPGAGGVRRDADRTDRGDHRGESGRRRERRPGAGARGIGGGSRRAPARRVAHGPGPACCRRPGPRRGARCSPRRASSWSGGSARIGSGSTCPRRRSGRHSRPPPDASASASSSQLPSPPRVPADGRARATPWPSKPSSSRATTRRVASCSRAVRSGSSCRSPPAAASGQRRARSRQPAGRGSTRRCRFPVPARTDDRSR